MIEGWKNQNGKKELDTRKRKEVNRLKKLIKALGVDEDRIKLLLPTSENVAWMCVKLEEASDAIATSDVAIPYDNGAGRKESGRTHTFKVMNPYGNLTSSV